VHVLDNIKNRIMMHGMENIKLESNVGNAECFRLKSVRSASYIICDSSTRLSRYVAPVIHGVLVVLM
jgi:hypothetical protein